MTRIAVAVQIILGTALLLGCATPSAPVPQVKPALSLRDGGGEASAYYQLGRYHQAQGRLQQAIVAYRKALALDASHADARNALGTAHAALTEFEIAITEFSAAITADPNAAHFHNNLGYALYLDGRIAEAVRALEVAVALDSSNPRAWNNLGRAAQRLGDAARADAAFARAERLAAAKPPRPAPALAAATATRSSSSASEPRPADMPLVPPERSANWPIAMTPIPLVPLVTDNQPPALLVPVQVVGAPVVEAIPAGREPVALSDAPPVAAAHPETQDVNPPPPLRLEPAALVVSVTDSSATLAAAAPTPPGVPRTSVAEHAPPSTLVATPAAIVEVSAPATMSPDASEPVAVGALASHPAIVALPLARIDAAVESIVVEVPKALEAVSPTPGIVDLRWIGTAVVARPAQAEPGPTPVPFALEIANGNGINGMARKLGSMLAAAGLPAARTTNEKRFDRSRTVIYFREGRRTEAVALSARLPNRPVVMPAKWLRPGTDVRLALGRDLPHDVALIELRHEILRTDHASAATSQRSD
jgi:Tfp pilus assembly protein PilF